MIDGCINHKDIANAFAYSYKSVYSSSDANDSLKSKFEERFISYCNTPSSESLRAHLLSWDDVRSQRERMTSQIMFLELNG